MILAFFVAPFVVAPSTASAATCQNGYTGPDSNNLCTSTVKYECSVNTDNTVTIINGNAQVTLSGGSSGPGAQTGSATNDNGVTFNVSVTNGEARTCVAIATVPATPDAPVTAAPVTPKVVPSTTVKPKVLAPTSGDSVLPYILGAIVTLVVVVAGSRAATALYSRAKS